MIAGRLGVGVLVEIVIIPGDDETLEEVWVGFSMPPLGGACKLPPQTDWIVAVLAAMVSVQISAERSDFTGNCPRPGGSRDNEIVVCWRSF